MNFSKKMEEMKKSITTVDLRNIRNKIQEFQELIEAESQYSFQEIIDFLEQSVYELGDCLNASYGYDFQQEAIKLWKKEKISIFELIRKTPDFWYEGVNLRYTEDMNKNIINLARDMIRTINILQPGIEKAIRDGKIPQKQESEIERLINITLERLGKVWNSEREQMYNKSLLAICTFLENLGGLENYLNIYNSRMSELGCDDMQLSYNRQRGKGLLNKVTDLLDLDVLSKLDLNTKKILLSFYCNRATKEIEELGTLFFILKKVGNVQNAMELDDESLRKLVLEEKFLSINWKRELKKYKENLVASYLINEEEILTKTFKELTTFEIEEYVWEQGIDVQEFEKYYGEKSFEQDKQIIGPYSARINDLYQMKDASMQTLIYMVLTKSKGLKIKNWGYIPEINKSGKNSIESKTENILIGIDFPRFNMPVRLHINRQWLLNILNMTLGSSKIPVYQGYEDFFITRLNGRRKYMGTQILMPIQKEQRIYLQEAVETQKNNPNYNCIAHLNWLAYPNRVPKHLQNEPAKEVDLETGVISLSGVDVRDSDGR